MPPVTAGAFSTSTHWYPVHGKPDPHSGQRNKALVLAEDSRELRYSYESEEHGSQKTIGFLSTLQTSRALPGSGQELVCREGGLP